MKCVNFNSQTVFRATHFEFHDQIGAVVIFRFVCLFSFNFDFILFRFVSFILVGFPPFFAPMCIGITFLSVIKDFLLRYRICGCDCNVCEFSLVVFHSNFKRMGNIFGKIHWILKMFRSQYALGQVEYLHFEFQLWHFAYIQMSKGIISV